MEHRVIELSNKAASAVKQAAIFLAEKENVPEKEAMCYIVMMSVQLLVAELDESLVRQICEAAITDGLEDRAKKTKPTLQ